MEYEKLRERIRKDLKEGNPIIPGNMKELKKISKIMSEIEESEENLDG